VTDARTVIQQLVDELEERGAPCEGNPVRLLCCQGRTLGGCIFEHTADCSYEKALKDARTWLAAPGPSSPAAAVARVVEGSREPDESDCHDVIQAWLDRHTACREEQPSADSFDELLDGLGIE
jgi:hypothetical protein